MIGGTCQLNGRDCTQLSKACAAWQLQLDHGIRLGKTITKTPPLQRSFKDHQPCVFLSHKQDALCDSQAGTVLENFAP